MAAEQTTVRNVPADDLPEVLDMLLEHLGLRLMVERTPDYTAYELARAIEQAHGIGTTGVIVPAEGQQQQVSADECRKCIGTDEKPWCERTQSEWCGRSNPELVKPAPGVKGADGEARSASAPDGDQG